MNTKFVEVGYKVTKLGKHAVSCSLTGFGSSVSNLSSSVLFAGSVSALTLTAAVFAIPKMTHADVTLIDGGELSGFMITGDLSIGGSSSNTLNSYQGTAKTVATVDGKQTVFTGFVTEGGAGSGGGAGLGGVFFVDEGASLTLSDVVFAGNSVKGGTGGGDPSQRVGNLALSLSTQSVDVFSFDQGLALPTVTKTASGYVFSEIDLSATGTGLLEVGTSLSFGDLQGAPSAKVSSVNADKTVTLESAVSISPGDVSSVFEYIAPSGDQVEVKGYTVSADTIDFTNASSVQRTEVKNAIENNSLVFIGDDFSRVTASAYDANGDIETLTLADVNLDGKSGDLDIISLSTFSAKQFVAEGSAIEITGQMRGFEAGMALFDSNGNDLDLEVATVASDGASFTVSGSAEDVTALAGLDGFEGRKSPVISDNQFRLNSPRSDFYAGATLHLSDIGKDVVVQAYDATTGVVTLTSDNVLSVTEFNTLDDISKAGGGIAVQLNNVISAAGTSITVRSDGLNLTAGMELQGSGIADETTITNVGTVTNGFVTLTLNKSTTSDVSYIIAKSPLSKGGNLNDMIATDVGSTGSNGRSRNIYNSFSEGGEGQEGLRGFAGADLSEAVGGVGGDGGTGGNGSDGLPVNPQLVTGLIDATSEFIDSTGELAAAIFPDPVIGLAVPIPDPIEIAGAAIDLGFKSVALGESIYNNVQWGINLSNGLAGVGGDGGEGGEGGGGSQFFGGGAGGTGGSGGEGALSFTVGGTGGDGNRGGDGGFGAGGGQGGAGGDGGTTGVGRTDDGDPGDGGFGGFAAGDGSNGNALFGGGGSGFGASVFVRENGTLTVAGESLFQNNTARGGSSTNQGAAGDGAGAALFIMTGATVSLEPGLGNTIEFDDGIADNSSASYEGAQYAEGEGADLTIRGNGGLVSFNADNSYSGDTILEGSTLQAELGSGVHESSRLRFNGTASVVGQDRVALSLGTVGTLLQDTDFGSRRAGNDPYEIKWSGSGGFASSNVDGITIILGETLPGVGQNLSWGADGFFEADDFFEDADTSALTFGSEQSLGAVNFANDVVVSGSDSATVAVYNTGQAGSSSATLSGDWDANKLVIGQVRQDASAFDGTLYMTGNNSIDELHVFDGVLSSFDAASNSTFGTILDSGSGGQVLLWDGAELNLHAAEKATTITLSDNATLRTYGALTATEAVINVGAIEVLNGSEIPSSTNISGGTLNAASILNSASGTILQEGAISAGLLENYGTWNVANDTSLSVGQLTGTGSFCLETAGGDITSCVGSAETPPATSTTLTLTQSVDSSFAGKFTGLGGLEKDGVGVLTLQAEQSFLGGLEVSQGELITESLAKFADTLNVDVADGATLTLKTVDTIGTLKNSGSVKVLADQTLESFETTGGLVSLDANVNTTGVFNLSNTETSDTLMSVASDKTITAGGGLSGNGKIDLRGQKLTLSQAGGAISTYSGQIVSNCSDQIVSGCSGQTGEFNLTGGGNVILAGGRQQVSVSKLNVINGKLSLDGSELLIASIDVSVESLGTIALLNDAADENIVRTQSIETLDGVGTIELGRNTLNVAAGGSFEGSFMGTGTVNVADGEFRVNNSLTSEDGGLTVSNSAGTTISRGTDVNVDNVSVTAGATLNIEGTGSVDGEISTVTTNGFTLANTSTLHLGTGSYSAGSESDNVITANYADLHGIVSGSGTLHADNIMVSAPSTVSTADIRPGDSPGVQNFFADVFTFGENSRLQIEVQDSEGGAGIGYDQVRFTNPNGSLVLTEGSTLQIDDIGSQNNGGYPLDNGSYSLGQLTQFAVVSPLSVDGSFGTVTHSSDYKFAVNLATGSLVGLGDEVLAYSALTNNEKAMIAGMKVASSGAADQYYGGQFIENLTHAWSGDANLNIVYEKASPEVYAGVGASVEAAVMGAAPDWVANFAGSEGDHSTFADYNVVNFGSDNTGNEFKPFGVKASNKQAGFSLSTADVTLLFNLGETNSVLSSEYLTGSGSGVNLGAAVIGKFNTFEGLVWTAGLQHAKLKMDGSRVANNGGVNFSDVGSEATRGSFGIEYNSKISSVDLGLRANMVHGSSITEAFSEVSGATNQLDAMRVGSTKNKFSRFDFGIKLGADLGERTKIKGLLDLSIPLNPSPVAVGASYDQGQGAFSVNSRGLDAAAMSANIEIDYTLTETSVFSGRVGVENTWSGGSSAVVGYGLRYDF